MIFVYFTQKFKKPGKGKFIWDTFVGVWNFSWVLLQLCETFLGYFYRCVKLFLGTFISGTCLGTSDRWRTPGSSPQSGEKQCDVISQKYVLFRENVSSYRENMSLFRENVSSYRENMLLFGENVSSYRENMSLFRENVSSYRENMCHHIEKTCRHIEKMCRHIEKICVVITRKCVSISRKCVVISRKCIVISRKCVIISRKYVSS